MRERTAFLEMNDEKTSVEAWQTCITVCRGWVMLQMGTIRVGGNVARQTMADVHG